MALSSINPTQTQSWLQLCQHFETAKDFQLKNLFENDPQRFENFSIVWGDFLLDFSKNHITAQTMALLTTLAQEMQLSDAIEKYLNGDPINQTEGRAVLHTALRRMDKLPTEVSATLEKMKAFSDNLIASRYKGHTDKPITDIVNIGIGGSDLGPQMVVEALPAYRNGLGLHFLSNVDGDRLHDTLDKLNPETTLFIVVSKSFLTQETLLNATTAKDWLTGQLGSAAVEKHFVAVSANTALAESFGIVSANTFPMWDWVGGRFSLWSAVGLSICCAVGYDNFEKLLQGAHKMDRHFAEAPFAENIPVLLALLSVWYNNFFGAESEVVVPYSDSLEKLVPYLQQAVMESNGKRIDRSGRVVDYQTGTLVWGAVGCNAQHAFFQLLHQGTKRVPIDFIGFKKPHRDSGEQHRVLMANLLAQSEALMNGKMEAAVRAELKKQGLSTGEIDCLLPHKTFLGNKASNTLLIEKLTPETLGSLLAMYEHKIFVQGVLWNIFSYDQWGVELGKQLAQTIQQDLTGKENSHDASTAGLLRHLKK